MWRTLRRFLALVCLGGVVLGLSAFLARDPIRDALARLLSVWLSQHLQGTVEIGRLRGALWPTVHLHDVVLRDRTGGTLLHVEEIQLTYDWRTGRAGHLHLSTVHLRRPHVAWSRTPDGAWPLTQLWAAGGPASLRIHQLHIHDGQVTLNEPSLPGLHQITAVQAHLQVQRTAEGWQLDVHHVSGQGTPALVTLAHLQGRLRSTGQTRQLQALEGYTTGILHTAGGQLDWQAQLNTSVTPWHYQGRLALTHVNLATLVPQAPLESDLTLTLHLDGQGSSLETLHGTLRLDLAPSRLGEITLYPSQMQVTVDQGHVHIQHGDLHTSVARLTATGRLDRDGEATLQYDLSTDLAGVRALLTTAPLQGQVRLQGQATGSLPALTVQGTLIAQQVQYAAHRAEQVQLTYAGSPFGTDARLQVQLSAAQALVADHGLEQLTVAATYHRATHHVTVQADATHVAGTRLTGSGQWAWTETAQHLTLDTLLISALGHPWRLAAPTTVTREAAGVRLTPLQLVHAEERLQLSGAFDGTHWQDVRLHVTQLDLPWLQRWLALPETLPGRVSGTLHLTGPSLAPVFDATLQWQPARTDGDMPVDGLQATFRYAQQRVQGEARLRQHQREVATLQADLPLDLALTPLDLGQRVRPAPATLHLRLLQPDLAVLTHGQPHWPRLAGTLQGTLTLQGSSTALALTGDLHLRRWGVLGRVEEVNAPLQMQATLGLGPPTPGTPPWPLTLQRLTLRAPRLQGQVATATPRPFTLQDVVVHATGQWHQSGWEVHLERVQAQVTVPDWPRSDLRFAGRLMPQRLDLTQVQVRLPHSEVRGSGTWDWAAQQMDLTLESPRLHLDEVGAPLPASWPVVAQGSVTVRGPVAALQVEARWRYAGGQGQTTLTAHLQEPVPRYQLATRLTALDLAQVWPGAHGTLQATLQASGSGLVGPQRRAQLALRVETQGATVLPGLQAQVKASLVESTVHVETLQVRSTPLTLSASGVLSSTTRAALTYDVTLGDLSALQPWLATPVQATGRVSGTVQGLWPAFQMRHRLDVRAWRYGPWHGQRLQTDVTLAQWPVTPQVTLHAQVTDAQGPRLAASTLALTGTWTPTQSTFQANVSAGPYRQSSLAGQFAPTPTPRVTITRLHLQHRQSLRWENAGPITVAYDPAGQWTLDNFVIRHGRQEARGRGILMADGGLTAELHLQRVLMQPHLQAVSAGPMPLAGEMTLHLRLTGTLTRPHGEGTVHLTGLRWHHYALGEVRSQLQVRDTAINVDLRWQERTRNLGHLTGDISLDANPRLALRLQVPQLDLQGLTAVSPAVLQSAGRVQADVQVTGTLAAPQVYGTVQLTHGLLQLSHTGVAYRDIQMQVTGEGTHLTLTRLHAASGDGTLAMTGSVELAGRAIHAVSVDLQMQRFMAVYTPDLEAEMAAVLALRGTPQDLFLTGTITLPKARAQWDGTLGAGRDTVQPWQLTVDGVYGAGAPLVPTTSAGMVAADQTSLAFLRTAVQLELPRNVWVRAPGSAIELQGTLMVTKERAAAWHLHGSLDTLRGFASFHSGQFVIDHGRVIFSGAPALDPLLDLVLTREVANYVVAIHVGGRATTPHLRLSSTPDLPQADIVTLLVVGKTTDRLTAAERSVLSQQAQQIVGTVAVGEVEQLLAKPLGFDSVDVQTADKLGNGKVSVGRYVTQDLFLSYERQIGNDNSSKVGIEYSINRHLKLKGSSNTRDAAFDILWRLDY